MAISRERKEELLAQYVDLIAQSDALFLAEYGGMSVKAMEGLRDKVSEANGAFFVTKNTLLKRALEEADVSVPDDILTGQLATGFALSEVPTLAKALVEYAKGQEHMTLKAAFLGGRLLTPADIEALAKLPTLDQLRAQIIGLLNAPAQNVASTIASGVRQVVNVIDAYAKSESESEAAETAV